MTAVHHLVWTHWIIANALATSLRESFNPHHPIRRVLHVNQWNTASINYMSFWTLFPENGFLHHMSGFSYEGLGTVFNTALEIYKYQTWPEVYEACDLPEEVKDKMPMFEDGLPFWKILHEFYTGYVDLYYESDEAVLADTEIVAYWRFQCGPQYSRGLPALSKAALVDQMTHAVFTVTGYHEFVGNVIGYVSDPLGGFLQVRPELNMADKQHMIQALSLAASTGSPMPRFIDDWSYLLDLGRAAKVNRYEEAMVLFKKMQDALKELSKTNKQRNETRPQAFRHFDPEFMESSVSL
mmetsp:Transcript_48852/g.91421  ORF Transcript_48852/g.91421 Transcript_48852/m.91421 type:complete len:296 (+) Transcript_48852:2-889(+)